ncbi:hypothetical protein EV589_0415 [Mycobacterium sp. BK558]|nr:hypothetical protein EV589_0415 [Mycobacterium sp. BK558]
MNTFEGQPDRVLGCEDLGDRRTWLPAQALAGGRPLT